MTVLGYPVYELIWDFCIAVVGDDRWPGAGVGWKQPARCDIRRSTWHHVSVRWHRTGGPYALQVRWLDSRPARVYMYQYLDTFVYIMCYHASFIPRLRNSLPSSLRYQWTVQKRTIKFGLFTDSTALLWILFCHAPRIRYLGLLLYYYYFYYY